MSGDVRGAIVVFGFKHAGKSSVGRLLAQRLGRRFVDLDEEILKAHTRAHAGESPKSVREIHATLGERGFSRLAREAMREAARLGDGVVLAGAPMHRGPTAEGRLFAHRVLIDTAPGILLERIARTGRPAFFDQRKPLEDAFRERYDERMHGYRSACTLRVDGGESVEVAERIARVLARPRICVPILERSNDAVVSRLAALGDDIDLAEIWLDQLDEEPEPGRWVASARHPLIACVKTEAEGGRSRAGAQERCALLARAAQQGVHHVDVGLDAGAEQIRALRKEIMRTWCELIVSHHDFSRTPTLPELRRIARAQLRTGAHACKIATSSHGVDDNLALVELLCELSSKGKKAIVIGMGEEGKPVRLLAPLLGSPWAFAPHDETRGSAPGQLTVRDMREAWEKVGR